MNDEGNEMAEITVGPSSVARIENRLGGNEGRNIVEITRGHNGVYRLATFRDGAMCSVDLRLVHIAELAAAMDAEVKRR